MPKLRPDDDVYRVRLLWLGPTGLTLPMHLPYAQWVTGVLLVAGSASLVWLVTGMVSFAWFAVWGSVPVTSLIFRFVNPDRPVRKILRTLIRDRRQVKPDTAAQLPSYSTSHIRFRRGIVK